VVLLDQHINVRATIVGGKLVYQTETQLLH
jgi:hypothetical protein